MAELAVYVVDDDASVRDSLALMLGLAGYTTRLFADAESFLVAFGPAWSGCVVADLRLPGMSGLELQARVRERGSRIPFVVITAHGDVPAARAAFLQQAVDGRAAAAAVALSAQRHDAQHVSIVVTDNGPGVAAADRERVFEPFVSGKPSGMGLGLAVSRAIAEAHGGTLGSRAASHGEFHLVLPFAHD